MGKKSISLTEGSLSRGILRFSFPLIFSNMLQVLFNLADIAVVGRFAGSAALGSVGSTATLVSLFTGFLMGIGNAVNVLTAQYLGARDRKNVHDLIHSAIGVCAVIGVLLLLFGVLFNKPILLLLKTKEELIDGALLYLRIYMCGMPALAIFNFGNAVFSAAGDTKKPLYVLSTAGIVNVGLNLLLVLVFHMDVAGVAIASAVSQWMAAFLVVWLLSKEEGMHRYQWKETAMHPDKVRRLLRLGVPSGFQNCIFAIANLCIQGAVNSFDAVIVEGNSAAMNADTLIYSMLDAFYVATSSYIGQNYGAGKKRRALRSYLICVAYAFTISMIFGFILALKGEAFLALFTRDPEVVAAGMLRLRIMGFSYCLSAFMDGTLAASRGIGKSVIPLIIVIMGSCVFRIIWIQTIFAHFRTIPSLYLLYAFSWSLTACAEIIYFIHSFRKMTAQMKDEEF